MDYFKYCQTAFSNKWATVDQLKVWVAKGKITADQYRQITNQVYVA
jgi:uncharacterized XkdX family phage protein